MRNKFLLSFGLFSAFLFAACSTEKEFRALEMPAKTLYAIDSLCMLQMDSGHFPGLAVAITLKGKLAWSKGYGFSNLEKKRPVDPAEDLFRIGSISKTITAAALARLTEKNKLELDVPISTYYPELPADKAALTLRQLGGHMAGIRHYHGLEFFSNIHYTNVIDPLEVFIHDTLLFEPGTGYSYSTYGWTLVSSVMELGMKKPFLDIIDKEVTDPLYLQDLKADEKDSTRYRRVSFYEFQNGSHAPSPIVDNSNKWAGGGFLCSAVDVACFGLAMAEPGYLHEETLTMYVQSQSTEAGEKTNYGIGIRSGTDEKGRQWYGHSGGSIGGTSMLLIYPNEDLAVVTLVNMGSAEMNSLAWKIANAVLELKDHGSTTLTNRK